MTDGGSIWQDIRPGDAVDLPGGRYGVVIGVVPGDGPCVDDSIVVVLSVTPLSIQQFRKSVLADDVVRDWPR